MNLNNVDNELNLKILEVFKIILKEENTSITFDVATTNVDEVTFISNKEHTFKLFKYKENYTLKELNISYYRLLPKKIKQKYTNLTDEELINYISSKKRYNLFEFLFGDMFIDKNYYVQCYKINYNNVVISLDKEKYDKLFFYTVNVYKLQQLNTLNKKLNIEQKFNIVFDDDTVKNELYDTFYKAFKDIIKPPGVE